MKIAQRLLVIFLLMVYCLLGFGGGALADSGGMQTTLTPETPINSPLLDQQLLLAGCGGVPEINSEIPLNPGNSFPSFECDTQIFAWETFVALNWPAGINGHPLKNKEIGDRPRFPRVWEFYPTTTSAYIPGKDKQQISSLPISSLPMQFRLTEFGKVPITGTRSNDLERHLPPALEALNKPLIDQFGNYILNEIRINPVEHNQIIGEELFKPKKIRNAYSNVGREGEGKKPFFLLDCSETSFSQDYNGDPKVNVPCRDNVSEGATEIKASWMVLEHPIPNDKRSKYYTTIRTFRVKSETGQKTVTVPVALVGLHVIRKTSNKGWIWATFEHVCNTENREREEICNDTYNLYNPKCSPENCPRNQPLVEEPYLWQDDFPHAITKKAQQIKPQISSQIVREGKIRNSKLNGRWRKALGGTVWENYQLIGTQWLKTPSKAYTRADGCEIEDDVMPGKLANVTLEPYFQTTDVGSSCIACHAYARLPNKASSDFSFLFPEMFPAEDIPIVCPPEKAR